MCQFTWKTKNLEGMNDFWETAFIARSEEQVAIMLFQVAGHLQRFSHSESYGSFGES